MIGVKLAFVLFTIALFSLVQATNFYGDDWQRLSAAEKYSLLADAINEDPKPFGWYNPLTVLQIFVEDHKKTMDSAQDQMPTQGPFGALTRKKLIHTVGAICGMKWVPTSNNTYSGVFQGTETAYIRMSTATQYTEKPFSFTPGLSIKFLRSGVKSSNIFAMYSLEGQEGFNFFKNIFSNHVPSLSPDASTILKKLDENFGKVTSWTTMIGLSDLATFDTDGKRATNVSYPFQLFLKPSDSVNRRFPDQYTGQVLLDQLSTLSPDNTDVLYHVYAKKTPEAPLVKIADIKLNDKCRTSKFADESLFFQHQRMEEDLKSNPTWPKSGSRCPFAHLH
ncbi:hypothetical protein AKO1_002852 [Acrasis kona]|uniref:Uncharacterized protein n=1 Tax=Acrasis kona TaxID=1008807 RepID=A0AAW2YZV6_9EUKA